MEDQPLEAQIDKVNSLKSQFLEPAEKYSRKHFQQLKKTSLQIVGPKSCSLPTQHWPIESQRIKRSTAHGFNIYLKDRPQKAISSSQNNALRAVVTSIKSYN